ncbi:CRE-ASB-1 protein, partial [Aphelenchoides avenae]
ELPLSDEDALPAEDPPAGVPGLVVHALPEGDRHLRSVPLLRRSLRVPRQQGDLGVRGERRQAPRLHLRLRAPLARVRTPHRQVVLRVPAAALRQPAQDHRRRPQGRGRLPQ